MSALTPSYMANIAVSLFLLLRIVHKSGRFVFKGQQLVFVKGLNKKDSDIYSESMIVFRN